MNIIEISNKYIDCSMENKWKSEKKLIENDISNKIIIHTCNKICRNGNYIKLKENK